MSGLKQQLGTLVGGTSVFPDLVPVVEACGFSRGDQVDLYHALAASPRPSIDAFLENRAEFRRLGKTWIAALIASCEARNPLLFASEGDWYRYFYSQICPRGSDLKSKQIDIITFNYDRSLESFLFQAARSDGLSEGDAKRAIAGIRVSHVHGDIGTHEYGSKPEAIDLVSASEQVKIVGEVEEEAAFRDARKMVMGASQICFLGCAYHQDNVRRLGISNEWPPGTHAATSPKFGRPPRKTVHGTTFGMMEGEVQRARKLFSVRVATFMDADILRFFRATTILDDL